MARFAIAAVRAHCPHSVMTSCALLPPQSLSSAIADRLRHEVLQGLFPPTEVIHDAALAKRYGIARAPIRDAMQLLCQQGLLQPHPQQGMTVRYPTSEQMAEAQVLQSLLLHHLALHPALEHGLAQRMLEMANQQLQLANLHS